VGTGRRNCFEKIGDFRKLGIADAFVIERSIARKRKLGTVPRELVHLSVIQLDCTDCLRRLEKPATTSAEPSVGCEFRML
jgi:hypothetical protein